MQPRDTAEPGFQVTGADIEDHSKAFARIGCGFHQMDWQEALARFGPAADIIHASPPCQHYSYASACRPGLAARYPDLIAPVRQALRQLDKPYVIENVPGAPLLSPIILCGTAFGLTTEFSPHGRVELRRERLFESSVPLPPAPPCRHEYTAIRVFGHGRPGNCALTGPGYAAATRRVMGIDWMSREALDEAIPPAFTDWIGGQLVERLAMTRAA